MALQLQISYCFPEYLTDGATISRLWQATALGGSLGRNDYRPVHGPKTTSSERHAQLVKRGFSFVYPAPRGLVLAGLCAVLTHNLTLDPASRVALFHLRRLGRSPVLRLLVQRERHVALQRVVSEIVGENTSPEVAAMRILEALCVAQGWDAASNGKSTLKKTAGVLFRLECSGSAHRVSPQDSIGLTMSPGAGMSAGPGKRDIRFGSRIWLPIRIPGCRKAGHGLRVCGPFGWEPGCWLFSSFIATSLFARTASR